MAWEENSHICLHMQLIAILSRIEVFILGVLTHPPLGEVHQPSNKCTHRIDSVIYLVGAAETAAPPEKSAPTATLKATTD